MRLTIRRKLFLAFGLAAFMMIGGTGVAYWAQVRAQATRDEIVKTYGILNDLEYLISYVRGVTVVSRAYIVDPEKGRFQADGKSIRKPVKVDWSRSRPRIALIWATSLPSQALSNFWKFIAAAERMALIASPATPFNRLRSNRCSFFRCPMLGSTAALRFILFQSVFGVRPRRRLST